jgi:hypothetical protein
MHKILAFFLLNLFSLELFADLINDEQADKCETILEIYIEKRQVVVKLEIGERDYPWFSDIVHSDIFNEGYTKDDHSRRWDRFMRSRLVLKSNNRILIGEVHLVEQRDKESRAGLAAVGTDTDAKNEKVWYAEIVYPIDMNFSILSVTPPMEVGSNVTSADIGFIAYHESIPVNDPNYLITTEVLHLDWSDPWYSFFENKSISRHHSSSFMSFLYVEPYEVRHEILCRVKDLEDWLVFDFDMDDMIRVEDMDSIKSRIARFLVHRNTVSIDGVEYRPVIDRIHFVEVTLAGVQIMEVPKALPYASAIIGIIFAYPHESMPKEVTMEWDLFNEKVQRVPCLSVDPAGPWPYEITTSQNVVKWTNFLKHYKLPTISEQKVEEASLTIPIFSVVCLLMVLFVLLRNNWTLNGLSRWRKFFFVLYILLGIISFPVGYEMKIPFFEKSRYSSPEALELVSQLLKNIYRAFDFRMESDVYDKLALSTTEQLLQQIYLQTRSGLVIENQGGIEARVDEVLVTNVSEIDMSDEGLSLRCNWIIKGVVGHWGHKHQRINQYDAIIKLVSAGGAWKMNELEMINEVRL